jgi:uncharacterized protein YlxW (UPF0749 family)
MPNTENDFEKPAYKSPPSKLVAFFRRSRDKWKEKYMDAKRRVKRLQDNVRYWKKQSTELKLRIKELEKELKESSKKKL